MTIKKQTEENKKKKRCILKTKRKEEHEIESVYSVEMKPFKEQFRFVERKVKTFLWHFVAILFM